MSKQTYTAGQGRITMSPECDYTTEEGKAAYRAAQAAAQAMANELVSAVWIHAATGYKLGRAQPKN